MVGSRSEHAGIIKDGAKMVNAVANSVGTEDHDHNWQFLWRR
jgi:hypothetical protein